MLAVVASDGLVSTSLGFCGGCNLRIFGFRWMSLCRPSAMECHGDVIRVLAGVGGEDLVFDDGNLILFEMQS